MNFLMKQPGGFFLPSARPDVGLAPPALINSKSPLFVDASVVRAATFQFSRPCGAFSCGAYPLQDSSQGNHSHQTAMPVLLLRIMCHCSNSIMYTYINIDR